ncbi:MAG: acetate--CoA ligase family protein [Bacillota bacterium]
MINRQQQIDNSKKDSNLETFFYPNSIAVIGASQNPLKPNGIPLYLLNMFSYKGDVYPVNPKYDRVGGLKCYRSVLDIEAPVDMAIIGVAEAQAMNVLKECADKKVKSVIIFTSGFAEIGEKGRTKQAEMKIMAEESGMRILGPNCLGVMNYYNGTMASFFYNEEKKDLVYPKTLSFITQSGGLGGIIYQMVIQLSIGFNYFVSTGNEADVSFAEVLDYLVKRDEVSIVAGYLEGLQGDGRLLIEACRNALEKGKLVTILKVGRTASGAAAASSHTGTLVGADEVYDGLFRQFCVPRADDVEQMNALITLFAAGRLPAGKRIAVITISGGGGVVVADKCPEYGLEVVSLNESTQQSLREFFPTFGAVRNPVDLTSQLFLDTKLSQKALRLVMQDPEIDVAGFFYNLEMPDPEASKKIIEVYKETDKPLIVFTWPTGQGYALEAKKNLVQAGIPVIEHIPSGLWAISALADWVNKAKEPFLYPQYKAGEEQNKSLEQFARFRQEKVSAMTEWRSKLILDAYKIPITRERLAETAEEAVSAAEEIGYPVVLKVMSPDLLHKTEVGGVILNISGPDEVKKAFGQILERANKSNPAAVIEGILVQEMLGQGLEVFVGIKKDPVFGPAVAFGLGGIFVEVLKDTAIRIAPLREEDAREMINEIKGKALFEGVRGRPPVDVDALVDILMKVSRLAVELKDSIGEIDINPLIVFEKGAGVVAADALIVPAKNPA